MCIRTILDASLFSQFAKEEMRPWRHWVEKGDGVLVYALSGRFGRELDNNHRIKTYILNQRKGNAQLVSLAELKKTFSVLQDREINSNNRHILELALASKAQILCTDDHNLKRDFKNLSNISGESRAVYPHSSDRQTRDAFLAVRRCKE